MVSDSSSAQKADTESITPTPKNDISIEQLDNSSIDATSNDIDDEHGLLNDPWHGDFSPVKNFTGKLPRIVCWGDSLTSSFDRKTAYPDYLRQMSGCEVVNYGVENETTAMIAMREGGIPVYVKETVIPGNCDLIPVFLSTDSEGSIFFLDFGEGGVNPCRIGGIDGTLSQINGSYYFARQKEGERRSFSSETRFETFGMIDKRDGDVLILFTGTNDMPDVESVYEIIDIQRRMLKEANCDRYIVIGLTYASGIPEIDEVNEILANEYEDHFLDIRNYALNYGLEDAGITPTDKDKADLAKGELPSSLRRDYVHGNSTFYELLAKQVYRRLQYLGYLPLDQGDNL